MAQISTYLKTGHGQCDALFATAEEAVAAAEWDLGRQSFVAFVAESEAHFRQEESVLFGLIERYTGGAGGPTAVMRLEHQQMRKLFVDIGVAIDQRDQEECLGIFETLLVLMQQHNAKEEQILYPMADRMLGKDAVPVIEAMRKARE